MPVGDLSTDQARFAARVTAGTGLDPRVVTSWVGTESGWNTYKPSHNYLNIGPGRSYASVDQAADAVIGLVRGSSYYGGIVASAAQGPAAQIDAIGSSKWGTKKQTLSDVFADLTGVRVIKDAGQGAETVDFTLPGWIPGVGGNTVDTPDLPSPGDVLGSISGDISKVAGAVTSQVLQGALSLVFTTASIALIGLGVFRLTSKAATTAIKETADVADKVSTVANLVPTPQTKVVGLAAKAADAF